MSDTYKSLRANKHLFGMIFLADALHSDKREQVLEVAKIMDDMPVTYEQDGLSAEEKTVYLHYVMKNDDDVVGEWFILEKDVLGETHQQAFGLVSLAGNQPEFGYINIGELHRTRRVFIDLDFKPTSLAAIQEALAA